MFSIITPLDTNRLTQFKVTKQLYDAMPQVKEFIIPTRTEKKVHNYLLENDLLKDVKFIPYEFESGFNCSMALNLGVKNAQYDNIIITSPEVKPITNVLEQLSECLGSNVICEVADMELDGTIKTILVSSVFRSDSPAMYFLAMFNKKDIEAINGWDEDFMKGYAYEDNDFGERWKRAGLPYVFRDDIKGVHQYHPRTETVRNGTAINNAKFMDNNDKGIVRCQNGIIKL